MIQVLQTITLKEASELLSEDAQEALRTDLPDGSLESKEKEDLRKAQNSALFRRNQQGSEEQFDPLYYRKIPELDMHLKTSDDISGAHTSTFVDVDEEYIVQIPEGSTPEEKRKHRNARLEHHQTYLDEGIPVTGGWEGREIYLNEEEIPILLGEYNPNLIEIGDLDGEELSKAESQAERIEDKVLDLMEEGKVSYQDNQWRQTSYGHRSWDSERETVVVDDLGEYIES